MDYKVIATTENGTRLEFVVETELFAYALDIAREKIDAEMPYDVTQQNAWIYIDGKEYLYTKIGDYGYMVDKEDDYFIVAEYGLRYDVGDVDDESKTYNELPLYTIDAAREEADFWARETGKKTYVRVIEY